ncbi:MFS transporter [Plebeiibacterium marinum]|uniref:MFS transporter n=1 Tax=Plebeiibacterium marinum TaxID=2992111 RepID=A0AAE3MD63_9BACT|nr:MFS transporter [Plebeiobacterium marinum]MCW3805491.1 MFS transporter [Plebeiobacterium marinum]
MKDSIKIIILAIICFVLGTSEFVIVGVLDKIASSAHISIAQAGQLISVFAITAAVGTPIAIFFLKNVHQRKILILSLAIILIACVMMFLSLNYQILLLARIIMALGVGVFNVYCFTVATSLAPANKRASAIATVTVGYNAALIVGLPIGRMVTSIWGWQSIFAFTAVFCLLAIPVIYKQIPAAFNKSASGNTNQFSILLKPKIILNILVSFFWILGYAMLYSYITPFLTSTTAMNENILSIALFAFGVATLIGNKSGGYFGDKIGNSKTTLYSMVFHVTSLVLLSVFTDAIYFTIFILMLWAVSAWAVGPILRFNVLDLSPEAPQFILSLYNSVIQLGFATGAALGGAEFEHFSPIILSWTAAAMVFIALIFTLVNIYSSSLRTILIRK